MVWTKVARVTTWTPEQQDSLPWRYRDRVLSCFGLLDEVAAERQQAAQQRAEAMALATATAAR